MPPGVEGACHQPKFNPKVPVPVQSKMKLELLLWFFLRIGTLILKMNRKNQLPRRLYPFQKPKNQQSSPPTIAPPYVTFTEASEKLNMKRASALHYCIVFFVEPSLETLLMNSNVPFRSTDCSVLLQKAIGVAQQNQRARKRYEAPVKRNCEGLSAEGTLWSTTTSVT